MPRRSRSRSRSRSRERQHRSRNRDADDRHGNHHRRDRDSREEDRHRDRHRSRDEDDGHRRASPDRWRDAPASAADSEQDKKRARLEKLKAWKQQQSAAPAAPAQQPAAAPEPAAPHSVQPAQSAKPAWTPWDDPELVGAAPAAAPAAPGNAAVAPEQAGHPAAPQPAPFVPQPAVPISIVRRRAHFEMEEAQKLLQKEDGEEEDALDAFMATEILPEVTAAQQAERAAKEQERLERAKALAEGKPANIPKLEKILDEDSDEETPDQELQIPAHKVKLVIGAGGEKIKFIQRKTKCRIQIRKEEDELAKGFGTGPVLQGVPRGVQKTKDGEVKMVTLMLFGDAEHCQKARDLIDEAVENREQKAKQRHKEYERKREAKSAQRQLYHLRHTLDYEALGMAIGTSKADIRSAYRKLAVKWHPDKHPNNQEEAKQKFQEIQRAFDALMSTDEDQRIEALGHR